jgi:TolB-like protein/Tfp pilus assembly protein PilF
MRLKNIARPVRVYEIKTDFESAAEASFSDVVKRPGPPHLSIVVLPFVNLAGDAEQNYFVDGVTESLTTDLSQMSGMLVIGRNTAFSYRNKPIDLKQIGRELNVRYVLEGSIQRSANRIRVNVQLIDAESGNHLWADRFDKPVADLFDMQDEIVARLANALNAQLITAEARRAERTPSPDSMDLYFRGMSAYNKGLTPDNLSEARKLFERALALDPGNVDAIVGTALASIQLVGTHMSDDRAVRLAAAETLAVKALSIAPEKASGHLCLGIVYIYTNRAAQGIPELERALAIDRNLAAAHAYIGLAQNFVGRGEETAGHIEDALRLSPRDTAVYLWRVINGSTKVFLAKGEEAVGELRRAIEANRNFAVAHFYLAVALAELGRLDEARLKAREGLSIDPTFTIRRYRRDAPSDNPIFMSRRRQIYEIMRAILTDCYIYGISAWDLKLNERTKQQDLIITNIGEPKITVDDIEVAQFVYLLLHNKKIRDVIDTIGRKGVLLLGRFTEGRIAILERLREELRDRGYLPIVFNFDKPETKDTHVEERRSGARDYGGYHPTEPRGRVKPRF